MANKDIDTATLFACGLPDEHDQQMEHNYARYRLDVYRKRHEWKGCLLREFFREDFSEFDQIMIRNLPLDVRRDLRTHLLETPSCSAALTSWTPAILRRRPDTVSDATHGPAHLHVSNEENPVAPQDTHIGENQEVPNTSRSHGFLSLMRTYTSSKDKYTGTLIDNFEQKLKVFNERCEQTGVQEHEKALAFSLMLDGTALHYYVDHIKNSTPTFHGRINKIKNRFETQERTLSLIREWDSISLLGYIAKNQNKSKNEALELMICRLQDLQVSLPEPYRPDLILKNKLLSACEGVDECRLARQKVAPTVDGNGFYKKNKRLSAYILEKLQPLGDAANDIAEADADNDDELDELDALVLDLDKLLDNCETWDEPEDGDLFANFTQSEQQHAQHFVAELADSATIHAFTKRIASPHSRRYSKSHFYGVAIDTCCSHQSTGGYDQFIAYCAFTGVAPKSTKVELWVVDADVPILLSLADMDRLQVVYDNLRNVLEHRRPIQGHRNQKVWASTRGQARKFCCDELIPARVTAEDVWRALRLCWIDVYLGPPNVLAHDAGKNLVARAFQRHSALMTIDTKPIPVESANSMTYVERYHAPIRRSYNIIRADLPNITEEEALQYAVKALNDSVGPDGLVSYSSGFRSIAQAGPTNR
eukprot:IDg22824t1